jgi:cell division protein FtsL
MRVFFRYLYIAVPLGIMICILAQLVISNQMIIYSNDLRRITLRVEELEEQNAVLKRMLVEQQSMRRIAQEAKKRGFVEATSYIAFTSDSFPVAIKR